MPYCPLIIDALTLSSIFEIPEFPYYSNDSWGMCMYEDEISYKACIRVSILSEAISISSWRTMLSSAILNCSSSPWFDDLGCSLISNLIYLKSCLLWYCNLTKKKKKSCGCNCIKLKYLVTTHPPDNLHSLPHKLRNGECTVPFSFAVREHAGNRYVYKFWRNACEYTY